MNALKIALHEYLVNVKRKEFLLITLGLPALMLGVVFLQTVVMGDLTEGAMRGDIGYVDKTGFFTNLGSPESINLTEYKDEEQAKQALLKGKISHYFVIPDNYMMFGQVQVYTDSKNIASGFSDEWLKDSLRKTILSDHVEGNIYLRAIAPAIVVPVFLDETGAETQPNLLKLIIPYAFAFVFVMAAFMTSGFLLQSIVSEKENRVIEILLSSVSPLELMAGKIIGLGAVGLTQVLIWGIAGITVLTSAYSVMQDSMPLLGAFEVPYITIALSVVYFVLGYLIFASVYAGVGAISTTQREGQQVAGMFGFIAALPLMFSAVIVKEPNSILAQGLSFFPLTAPIVMLIRLSLTDLPALEIGASIAVLISFVLLFMWLSAKVFRIGLLMYGKRPSVGQIMRLLRES